MGYPGTPEQGHLHCVGPLDLGQSRLGAFKHIPEVEFTKRGNLSEQ